MEFYIALLMLLAGTGIGGVGAWLARGRRIAAERDRAARAETALQEEKIALTAANATLAAEREAQQQKIGELVSLRGEIELKLQTLAADALKGNQQSFLTLAEQVLARHKQSAAESLEQRQKAIEALVGPIRQSLDEYRKGLGEIEKAREAAYGGLMAHLQDVVRTQTDVSRETRKLVTALQAAPKTRGRWGEQQLHNVMELSGMTPYIDFDAERTLAEDDTRLRPDIVIRLPGDRRIVVDAKTSMAAYLDAVDATEAETREAHLDRHARQLRTHMKQLAGKAYWEVLPFTPDFVVMFIPGENFFAAAIERDPQLFEDAVAERVLIVTPTTLIALAKAIAFGWRQEKVADNARRVAQLGRTLYRRLTSMGGHVADLGKGLESAVRRYNEFVGSLEQSVMPQARRFNELEVDGTQDPIPELRAIEPGTRQIRADRDLVIPTAGVIPLAAAERAHPGERPGNTP
jgi:DNA recombination protein RmuC